MLGLLAVGLEAAWVGAGASLLAFKARLYVFFFLFSENKNSFSRKGVLRTKQAESVLPVPGPLNACEHSKMVVCFYYYHSLS